MAGVEPVYVRFSAEGAPSANCEYVSRDARQAMPRTSFGRRLENPLQGTGPEPVGFFKPGL